MSCHLLSISSCTPGASPGSIGVTPETPALLTRISTRSQTSTTFPTITSTSSLFVTSQRNGTIRWSPEFSSMENAWRFLVFREATATRAPSL